MNDKIILNIIKEIRSLVFQGYSIRLSTRMANRNTNLDRYIRRHPEYVDLLNEYKAIQGSQKRFTRDEKNRIIHLPKVRLNESNP